MHVKLGACENKPPNNSRRLRRLHKKSDSTDVSIDASIDASTPIHVVSCDVKGECDFENDVCEKELDECSFDRTWDANDGLVVNSKFHGDPLP